MRLPVLFAALAVTCAVALPAASVAQPAPRLKMGPVFGPQVALESAVFVEHTKLRDGATVRSLEPATRLAHGDRVVTLVTWYRLGGSGGFTVTNPIPAGLAWQRSADDAEEVSADGGHSWGRLGSLRVNGRLAVASDITHVRWRVSPDMAEAGTGEITYSGVVR